MKIILFAFVLLTLNPITFISPQNSTDIVKINIDAVNLSNKKNIDQVQRLFIGATSKNTISDSLWSLLKEVHLKKVRLINYENNILKFNNAESKYEYDWTKGFIKGLANCKKYNLIPHVVVGNALLSVLSKQTNIGPRFDETKWNIYSDFAYNFMKYVSVDNGFNDAEFEIGNEPDWNGVQWLSDTELKHGSEEAYSLYLRLYETWSKAFEKLKKNYPELKIKIGGPAITVNPFINGRFNWASHFIEDVAKNNLPLNFFSFHYYGDNSRLSGTMQKGKVLPLGLISKEIKNLLLDNNLRIPVYLTEWGPSYWTKENEFGVLNANNVGAAWTADFLNFAANLPISEGYLLMIRDIPEGGTGRSKVDNWAWPAYFTLNEDNPKPIYNVISMYSKMRGTILNTTGSGQNISTVASSRKDTVYVLLFNYNWDFKTNTDNTYPETLNLNIKVADWGNSKIQVTKYEINNKAGNLYHYIKNNLKVSRQGAGLTPENIKANINNNVVNIEPVNIEPSSVILLEITKKSI